MRKTTSNWVGTCAVFWLLLTFSSCQAQASAGHTLRSYVRLGTLFLPPGGPEIGYPDSAEPDLAKTHFGLGFQAATTLPGADSRPPAASAAGPQRRPAASPWKMGMDLGVFRLFAATGEPVWLDNEYFWPDDDTEWLAHLDFFLEYAPPGTPVFLQAGPGLAVVFANPPGPYDNNDYFLIQYRKPVGHAHLGMMAAGGLEFPVSESMAMMVMARIDPVLRHGTMIPAAFAAGLSLRQ